MTLMTLRAALILAAPLWLGALTETLAAQSSDFIFFDSFESGDFSNSENGFRWSVSDTTSIVRDDGLVTSFGTMSGGNRNQWENGPGVAGRHAMCFRYPADEAWSEQRFNIGEQYPELWISFWFRVPINFTHPDTRHSNQKLLAVWMDGYEGHGDGPTVVWQFRHDGRGGSISRLYHWKPTAHSDGHRHSGEVTGGPLITTPQDRGRWMHLVFRVVAAPSFDVDNGIIQMWQRWESESEYTLLHDDKAGRLQPPPGYSGWRAGYLMGWANAAYANDTEFLLDDFKVSTTSLLHPSVPVSVRPNAPSNVVSE